MQPARLSLFALPCRTSHERYPVRFFDVPASFRAIHSLPTNEGKVCAELSADLSNIDTVEVAIASDKYLDEVLFQSR